MAATSSVSNKIISIPKTFYQDWSTKFVIFYPSDFTDKLNTLGDRIFRESFVGLKIEIRNDGEFVDARLLNVGQLTELNDRLKGWFPPSLSKIAQFPIEGVEKALEIANAQLELAEKVAKVQASQSRFKSFAKEIFKNQEPSKEPSEGGVQQPEDPKNQ